MLKSSFTVGGSSGIYTAEGLEKRAAQLFLLESFPSEIIQGLAAIHPLYATTAKQCAEPFPVSFGEWLSFAESSISENAAVRHLAQTVVMWAKRFNLENAPDWFFEVVEHTLWSWHKKPCAMEVKKFLFPRLWVYSFGQDIAGYREQLLAAGPSHTGAVFALDSAEFFQVVGGLLRPSLLTEGGEAFQDELKALADSIKSCFCLPAEECSLRPATWLKNDVHFRWFIQYKLGGRTFRELADQDDEATGHIIAEEGVREAVKQMATLLDWE